MQTVPEQDGAPAPAKPTPLFRIDPGWPFVIAGLLLLVAGVLIPAQRDLQELRNTLEIHRALEDQSIRQLAAYDRFLNDLDHGDEQLVGRLAASQLNLMPKDERSMLLVPSLNATVTQWIEDSEPAILPNPPAYPDTLLSRLATGPRRLWVLACGAFLVFVGLMLSPSAPSARRGARRAEPRPAPEPSTDMTRAALVAAVPAAAAASSTLVIDDSDASSEEHAACASAAADGAAEVSSRLDVDGEVASDELEAGVEAGVEAEAEVEAEAQSDEEIVDEIEPEEDAGVDGEAELDSVAEFDAMACVDGEPIEMPDAVLAADAEVVCMSEMTRASETGAAIIELKPPSSGESDAAELPHADAVATLDGGSGIESEARAQTEAMPGEVDHETELDVEGACEIPSANDRALDSISLFHGLGEDRWISTTGRA